MKLPYRLFARGGFEIYQPMVSVVVDGEPFDALLDTGADICTFPTDKELAFTSQTGGQPSTKAVLASMSIIEEGKLYAWDGLVTFSRAIDRPLLGWLGFLEYFDVVLNERDFELHPNKKFPGNKKDIWAERTSK